MIFTSQTCDGFFFALAHGKEHILPARFLFRQDLSSLKIHKVKLTWTVLSICDEEPLLEFPLSIPDIDSLPFDHTPAFGNVILETGGEDLAWLDTLVASKVVRVLLLRSNA